MRDFQTEYDMLVVENRELRDKLTTERLKNVELRDAIDGMSTDMSFMELRIAELEGRDPL